MKKTIFFLAVVFFASPCLAGDPLKGLNSQATESITELLQSASQAVPTQPVAQAETSGWFDGIKKALGGMVQEVTTPAAQETISKAETAVNAALQNVTENVIPVVKQNFDEAVIEVAEKGKDLVDHAQAAVQGSVVYAAEVARHNLDQSSSHAAHLLTAQVLPTARENTQLVTAHAAHEMSNNVIPAARENLQQVATHTAAELKSLIKSATVAVLCVGFSALGVKLVYDGFQEYEGKKNSKAFKKMCAGTAITFTALFSGWYHFR